MANKNHMANISALRNGKKSFKGASGSAFGFLSTDYSQIMTLGRHITLVLCALGFSGPSVSYGDILADYAQKAVLKNPEVLSRWHTFKAATDEIGVASGAYLPRVDLSAGGGLEKLHSPSTGDTTLHTNSIGLALTQMLYDGNATRDEVRRLNHAQLTRYYELLESSEGSALETVRAYYDVMRNRELLVLTEDNFVYHRTIFEQIQNKVKAGVGRRVDLEQASGRLALSESNLVTDNANIHDVSARFQRIVGELPVQKLGKSDSLQKLVPPNAEDAHLAAGIDQSPAILASVENVRAAKYDVDQRQSKFKPKVDFRLSQTESQNTAGLKGHTSDTLAQVVVNWNLFNGRADSNQISQYSERLNAARDQRDKTCRDIRQNLAIAYNDIWKITEQLRYLEQHQLSIEKAKGAYQKQFEIGQRTLLDLLDTENELYSAKRSYVNAGYDLLIAYARTLAGMGKLTGSLGLSRLDTPDLPELLGMSSDGPETCPPESPMSPGVHKEELVAKAIEAAKPAQAVLLPGASGASAAPSSSDKNDSNKQEAEPATPT